MGIVGWAARVLVNSTEACWHCRKEVVLPSHVATFSQTETDLLTNKPLVKSNGFLSLLGLRSTVSKQGNDREIKITRHLCKCPTYRTIMIFSSTLAKWNAVVPDDQISSKNSESILALEFNSLQMHVDALKIVLPHSKKKELRYLSS
uniref:Uncharacterized protein n=1 Tax=Oryza barthii TaxID=65489 RepID=A0A0D3GXY6_9ORYZ